MSAPRKLSVRKSDGSVFDSSDDESVHSTRTTPWKDLEKGSSELVEAAKFFLNAFSKALPEKIQVKVGKNESVEECNTLLLSPAELILRRLVPYRCYSATLNRRSGAVEHSKWENDQNDWTTVVQVCPKSGIGLGKGEISRITAFNLTKNHILEIGEDFDAKIGPLIEPSTIPVAKEAKLSFIEKSETKAPDSAQLKGLLKSFFAQTKLLLDSDVIELASEDGDSVFYEISFTNGTDKDGQKQAYYVNQSTSLYQLPKKRRFFPRHQFDCQKQFLPKKYFEIEKRMSRLFQSTFNVENSTSFSNPLICVLASTSGNGPEKVVQLLADQLCVDLVTVDCLQFWNIEGRSTDKIVDAAMEKAQNSVPSLVVFENIAFLGENSPHSLEAGSKTVDRLCRKLSQVENSQIGFIFTCQKSDLPNLPKPLTQLIHFEFTLPDLENQDRIDFIQFQKRLRTFEIPDDVFANLTRGFVLAELEQLVEDSLMDSVFENSRQILQKHVEKAVEKRNKSFSEAVGAPKIPTVTWDDVGGLEDVKKTIAESLMLNLDPKKCNSNMKRSGIVLYGPPGCGKTLMAKAVANQFDITFLSVKGPELLNQYVGQSEQNLRTIFEKARLASPSIVFFDEVDSLAPNRGAAGDSGGVMDRMVSQLLAELDTLHAKQNCDVFVMAATNRPDLLDPCLLTPGRFDKSIHVKPATDLDSKVKILKPLCKKLTLAPDLTPETIAQLCPETVSGAEISAVVQKSAMAALREVILDLEAKHLTGNEEQNAIENAQVVVRKKHVELALKNLSKERENSQ